MKHKTLRMKRHFINGKIIIGIDPSKEKHQAMVINSIGDTIKSSFTFKHNYHGFKVTLAKRLKERLQPFDPQNIIFAIETSINYWQKLCSYLNSKGFTVVLVRPLATRHERPKMSNNFTRTDPKDALAVANVARQGYFHFYQEYSDSVQAMQRLSITYDKISKDLCRFKQRLRAQVELLFPEFADIVKLGSNSAYYLLSKILTPQDAQNLNVFTEAVAIKKVSRNHFNLTKLETIREAANNSIGLPVQTDAYVAERLTMNVWLSTIKHLEEHLQIVQDQMVALAKQLPYFDFLTSLKGIRDISAARFIAETRVPSTLSHHKKIEATAGLNLKLAESGKYSGYRRISHIGNHRLRAVLYKMAEETKNHVPEVRIRFIKRQMKQQRYKKNVVAVSSNLCKLIVALLKENRPYRINPEKQQQLQLWERKYQDFKNQKKTKHYKKAS
jgi:transposase